MNLKFLSYRAEPLAPHRCRASRREPAASRQVRDALYGVAAPFGLGSVDVPGNQTRDRIGMGCDHEMRCAVDRHKRRAVEAAGEKRVGALYGGMAGSTVHDLTAPTVVRYIRLTVLTPTLDPATYGEENRIYELEAYA